MEETETPVRLTERAAKKVLEIREENQIAAEQFLRLVVHGGGCAGFTYDLGFDAMNPDVDRRFTLYGVEVIVDEMSLMYLAGTEVDYVESLRESGFKFRNPNVTSTCGCGSSFSV